VCGAWLGRRHAFSIVRMDTKKTYVMHAKSPEDKHLWLSAIEQVFFIFIVDYNYYCD
jgi:hypothetical protein